MKPIALVLGLLFAAALGCAWWILRPVEYASGLAAAEHSSSSAASTTLDAPTGPATPALAATEQPTAPRVAAPVEHAELDGPSAPGATRLAHDGPTYQVKGRVVDDAQRPLAGVSVQLRAPHTLLPPWEEGERTPPAAGGATTDAEGRFALNGVAPGTQRIALRKSGFAPFDKADLAVPAADHDLGDLAMSLGVIVEGRVVDHIGRPVAGARISRSSGSTGGMIDLTEAQGAEALAATSAADGSFSIDQLAAGPFHLRVASDEHPSLTASGSTQRAGERIAGFTIQLEEGATIEGRIEGAKDASMENLRVLARPSAASAENETQAEAGWPMARETRRAQVDADGRFVLRGLKAGQSYRVSARRSTDARWGGGGSVTDARVARAPERALVLRWMNDGTLSFELVDLRTNQPVEMAEVRTRWQGDFGTISPGGRARSYPNGEVRLENLRPAQPTDRLSLRVEAPGYEPLERTGLAIVAGEELALGKLALTPAPGVRVRVTDARDGKPVGAARVTLAQLTEPIEAAATGAPGRSVAVQRRVSVTGSGPGDMQFDMDAPRRNARTDEDGKAVLNSIGSEPMVLVVRHENFAPACLEVVSSGAGGADVDVKLGQGGEVEISALDDAKAPASGVRIEHSSPSQRHLPGMGFERMVEKTSVTDATGKLVVRHLEPGVHRFRVGKGAQGATFVTGSEDGDFASIAMDLGDRGADEAWHEVSVVEGGRATLQLVAPVLGVLEGCVREAGTPLAGATVSLRATAQDSSMPDWLTPPSAKAKTDGHGRYRLDNVELGAYRISVQHPERAMPSAFDCTLRQRQQDFDLNLDLAIVEGRVLDQAGKPVAGARVRVEAAGATGAPRGRGMALMVMSDGDGSEASMQTLGPDAAAKTTDQEGRFTLRGAQCGTQLALKATAKDFQPASSKPFELESGQHKSGVEIELAAGGKLSIQAKRPSGAPAGMLLVTASYVVPKDASAAGGADGEPIEPKTALLQQSGKTTLDGLKPGLWKVELRPIGIEPSAAPAAEIPPQETTVAAGQTHTLEFVVPDAEGA